MMKITRTQFILITLLFLLLPFSVQWKLLLFGGRTQATVIQENILSLPNAPVEDQDVYTKIRFEANGRYFDIAGPENVKYPVGKQLTIFYNKKNPEKYVIASFSGIFLNNKTLIPLTLLLFWFAFYATVNQKNRKNNKD
jgi:hypothetical protein